MSEKKFEQRIEQQRLAAEHEEKMAQLKQQQEEEAKRLKMESEIEKLRERIQADPRWQEMWQLAHHPDLIEALTSLQDKYTYTINEKKYETEHKKRMFGRTKQISKEVIIPKVYKPEFSIYSVHSTPHFNQELKLLPIQNEPLGRIIVKFDYASYKFFAIGFFWREEEVNIHKVKKYQVPDNQLSSEILKPYHRKPGYAIELLKVQNDRWEYDNEERHLVSAIVFYNLDDLLNFMARKIALNEEIISYEYIPMESS